MLSEKQLNANRNNCLKSTGPRTAEGKHTAAQNSFKHGLRSSHIVSRTRDNDRFKQFRDELLAQLAPVGLIESHLADQAASALWKMQRLGQLEPELLDTLQNRYIDNQIADDQEVLTPKDRILDFETLFYSTMKTYPDPAFQLRFEGALNFWLKTPEGKTYKEGRWSILPGSKSYIQCFKEFWAEYYGEPIDPKYYDPQDNTCHESAESLSRSDSTVSNVTPIPQEMRTDLSYQVMLESRATQSNVAESTQSVIPADRSESRDPGSPDAANARHPESPLRGEGSDRIASRSDSSINHLSLISNQLEGSNPEAIASVASGSDGVEKLASNTGTAAGPAVSDKETGLNPLRASSSLRGEKDSNSVPSVANNLNPSAQSVLPVAPEAFGEGGSSLAPAMVEDFSGSNVLLKFSRYQTQAERSLYRVLNELTKLQSLRKRNEAILNNVGEASVLHNNE